MGVGTLAPRNASLAVAARLSARVRLTGIVAVSFALRAAGAHGHVTPRYFPDEYIYTALARSIASSGAPAIRGGPAHFPAMLEPIVAAPVWALASTHAAYVLVQALHALLMSLAAVPAYLLAREARLRERDALLCAVFAVSVPDLVFSAYMIADPLAYPLVLTSLWCGLVALNRPGFAHEARFLAFAFLATLARVQYVALVAAFAVAAVALHGRATVRRYRLLAGGAVLGVAAVAVLGPARFLGYYSESVLHLDTGSATLRWAMNDLFLLAIVGGVVLVPGAVSGLLGARGREERAFALLAGAFGALVVAEAALYASNGSDRFQERYLFMLLPLLPIACLLDSRRIHRRRLPGYVAAALLLVALARLPLEGFAAGLGTTDSPFLAAFALVAGNAQDRWSLLFAIGASAAVAGGALMSARRAGGLVVALAIGFTALVSVGSTVFDNRASGQLRHDYLAGDLGWIDAAGLHDVAAVQTPGSPTGQLLEQLFWNTSLTREVVLGKAKPTDAFAAPELRAGRDGRLRTAAGTLKSPFLFQSYGTRAELAGARLVARKGTFSLWVPDGAPRLRALAEGWYWDGWLGWQGRVTVWPDASGRTSGTLRLELSLPARSRPVDVWFGSDQVRVRPGTHTTVELRLDARGPESVAFHTRGGGFDGDLRQVSVRSSVPRFDPAPS